MNRKNYLWNDDEIRASVDAYLYMLQLETYSIPYSFPEYSKLLQTGPLRDRNDASIRYRMRNISQVMEERGAPILSTFVPASQVGSNVKKKINDILDERQVPMATLETPLAAPSEDIEELSIVITRLDELKAMLADLMPSQVAGFGHNNPPGIFAITQDDVSEAKDVITMLQRELPNRLNETQRQLISENTKKLSKFGLKLAIWSGERITDFAKAGAVAAGSGFGIWLSGLGDQIIQALRFVAKLVG